jgi:hypothetical protein
MMKSFHALTEVERTRKSAINEMRGKHSMSWVIDMSMFQRLPIRLKQARSQPTHCGESHQFIDGDKPCIGVFIACNGLNLSEERGAVPDPKNWLPALSLLAGLQYPVPFGPVKPGDQINERCLQLNRS